MTGDLISPPLKLGRTHHHSLLFQLRKKLSRQIMVSIFHPEGLPSKIYGLDGPALRGADQSLISITFDETLNWKLVAENATHSHKIYNAMPALVAINLGIDVTEVQTYGLQPESPSSYTGPDDNINLGTQWMGYIHADLVETLADKVNKGQLDHGNLSILEGLTPHLVRGSLTSIEDPTLWYIPKLGSMTQLSTIWARRRTPVIVGIILAVTILLALGFVFLWKLRRRKQRSQVRGVYPYPYPKPPSELMELELQEVKTSMDAPTAYSEQRARALQDDLRNSPAPRSPSFISTASTIRQQILLEKCEIVTARIKALESLVESSSMRLTDAEVEIGRLRMENQRLREQEQSDWALGLTDELPPAYADLVQASLPGPSSEPCVAQALMRDHPIYTIVRVLLNYQGTEIDPQIAALIGIVALEITAPSTVAFESGSISGTWSEADKITGTIPSRLSKTSSNFASLTVWPSDHEPTYISTSFISDFGSGPVFNVIRASFPDSYATEPRRIGRLRRSTGILELVQRGPTTRGLLHNASTSTSESTYPSGSSVPIETDSALFNGAAGGLEGLPQRLEDLREDLDYPKERLSSLEVSWKCLGIPRLHRSCGHVHASTI
ncbi:hypothetical protein C8J56DRAFT_902106 [Mycena floridula]|nr:hypothetical protein C8J56DRAFT_902106 [Mycena floridula]